MLVGGQEEEDTPQAAICNTRGSLSSGGLVCLWGQVGKGGPQHLTAFFCCLNELMLHLL